MGRVTGPVYGPQQLMTRQTDGGLHGFKETASWNCFKSGFLLSSNTRGLKPCHPGLGRLEG